MALRCCDHHSTRWIYPLGCRGCARNPLVRAAVCHVPHLHVQRVRRKSLWEHIFTLYCHILSQETRVSGGYKAQNSRFMSRDSFLGPFRQMLTAKIRR